MKNGKLQIGIVGCGGIAHQKHLPALTFYKDKCDIVALCDIIEQRAIDSAAEYGLTNAAIYTDYKELLKDDSIDIVYVLTPNVAHSQITVDSFEAGKHVFCEKPMSHSSAEAQRMIDAWKKSGKQFTIGYQNRFRPEIQTIHKACEAGDLGDIYFAKAHALRRRAVPTWGVFMDKEKQGGGPLIDIGTHALDLTLWNMNNYKPKRVTGSVFHKMADKFEGNQFGPWDPATFDVEDSAFGFIQMENGATIYLEASWILNITEYKEACITLCGTEAGAEIVDCHGPEGTAQFNSAKYGELISTKPDRVGPIAFFDGINEGAAHVQEARQWLDAVINGTEPLVKPEQAFTVTQILEAIYNSAATGKTIEL
jgi:predicted dehydrogenase